MVQVCDSEGAGLAMARSPRRIAQRRGRSRSRELTRLRTQLSGRGKDSSLRDIYETGIQCTLDDFGTFKATP